MSQTRQLCTPLQTSLLGKEPKTPHPDGPASGMSQTGTKAGAACPSCHPCPSPGDPGVTTPVKPWGRGRGLTGDEGPLSSGELGGKKKQIPAREGAGFGCGKPCMAEQMLCSWARWSPAAVRDCAWDRTLDPAGALPDGMEDAGKLSPGLTEQMRHWESSPLTPLIQAPSPNCPPQLTQPCTSCQALPSILTQALLGKESEFMVLAQQVSPGEASGGGQRGSPEVQQVKNPL